VQEFINKKLFETY